MDNLMSIIGTALAFIGGLAIIIGITCGIINLYDLFERVERLECNDNVRREDILDIESRLIRIEGREGARLSNTQNGKQ